MEYRLDIEEIKKDFVFKESTDSKFRLQHNSGKKFKLLPYTTKKSDDNSINLEGVAGDFSSLISGKNYKMDFNMNSLCKLIIDRVEVSECDIEILKNILTEVLFNKNGDITVFHPIIFNYKIKHHDKNDKESKISRFLHSVLFDDILKEKVDNIYGNKPKNLLLRLVIDSLPQLNDDFKVNKETYVNYVPFIKQVFTEDFEYMFSNEKFYVDELERVLKYYYFFYVSQLTLKITKMFDADITRPDPLYFHLESERLSKSRTSYSTGWESYLSDKIENLFSHAICLELLNHNLVNDNKKYTYVDLKNTTTNMDEFEKEALNNDLELLINLYVSHIQDVDWNLFNFIPTTNDECLKKVYELFRRIEFQFLQSENNRLILRKRYYLWFLEFCKKYFLKRHGPLGYTLNLSQDYLILITRLCIKDRDKIGVKALFLEFEKRGLLFDRDTKEAIMKMFEKLNLLEKKSDSGDAQYVKAIL